VKEAEVHEALARANFARDAELLSPLFLQSRSWTLNAASFPLLDVTFVSDKPLRLRLHCDEWNELPPSVQLLKADGTEWEAGLQGPTFHQDKHPVAERTFICMVGSREYHTHPSHLNDLWANYKDQDGMNLPGLLDRFSRAWRKEMKL
jgi:hypothetical protein